MVSSAEVPPDCDARIGRILAYWRSIRPAENRLPGRQHVEPTDLAELLRWIWLVDVQRDPLRFRFRLLGTGHREVMGADFTGKWIDEVFADFPSMQEYAEFLAVVRGEASYCRRMPEFPVGKKYVSMERLLLPLARDGVSVDMMLALTLYTRADGTTA